MSTRMVLAVAADEDKCRESHPLTPMSAINFPGQGRGGVQGDVPTTARQYTQGY